MSIFINGNPASGLPASYPSDRVTYDNTSSGLTSDDVQGAIDELASGGSGGHIIENPSGTDMTQRAKIQFVDAGVSDDSVNDRTEIEILQEIASESDLNSAPDGVYQGSWDESVSDVLTADMVGYGSGTVEDKLDELAGRFYTIDYPVKLNQQTWTASGSGMYYAVIAPPNGDTVVSALCSEWSNLRTSDFVQPYTENNNVGLISNVSSFATGASAYNLRVLYCKN